METRRAKSGGFSVSQPLVTRLSRLALCYTDGEPAGVVKEFLEFTLSDAGQKIVEQVGFVPIK